MPADLLHERGLAAPQRQQVALAEDRVDALEVEGLAVQPAAGEHEVEVVVVASELRGVVPREGVLDDLRRAEPEPREERLRLVGPGEVDVDPHVVPALHRGRDLVHPDRRRLLGAEVEGDDDGERVADRGAGVDGLVGGAGHGVRARIAARP